MEDTNCIIGIEDLNNQELQINGGGLIVFAFIAGVIVGYLETH